MRIVLVAEEAAGLHTLRTLLMPGLELMVFTSPSEGTAASPIWKIAEESGHLCHPANLLGQAETEEELQSWAPDILLNVHSLQILHEAVLAIPRLGSFNLHPGKLPEYAGLNTVSWAILRGEHSHAVTLHRMTGRIDAGEIVFQESFPIEENETAFLLYGKCVRRGVPLIQKLIELIRNGQDIPVQSQDLSRRAYFGRKAPNGGLIDWKSGSSAILRLLRACDYGPFTSPWGKAWTTRGDERVELLSATQGDPCPGIEPGRVSNTADGTIAIATSDFWLLPARIGISGKTALAKEKLAAGDLLSSQV